MEVIKPPFDKKTQKKLKTSDLIYKIKKKLSLLANNDID